MNYVTTADDIRIFYKDWGPRDAQPLVFQHGWPLTADEWDNQMLFFYSKGFRRIARNSISTSLPGRSTASTARVRRSARG